MSTHNAEIFSNRLKNRLREREMTQAKLASLAGVSPQTVNTWLSGRNYPRVNAMSKVASILETTTGYLYGETESSDAYGSFPTLRSTNSEYSDSKSSHYADLHPKIQAQAEALMDEEGFTEMKELVTYLVKEETKRRGATEGPAPTAHQTAMEKHHRKTKELERKRKEAFE